MIGEKDHDGGELCSPPFAVPNECARSSTGHRGHMLFPCQIVLRGAIFYDTPLACRDLVRLEHEPTNPHDPDAVVARTVAGVIGYLPTAVARRVIAEYGPGAVLRAEVEQLKEAPRLVHLRVLGPVTRAPRHLAAPVPIAYTPAPSASVKSPAPLEIGEVATTTSGRTVGRIVAVDGALATVERDGTVRTYPLAHLRAVST